MFEQIFLGLGEGRNLILEDHLALPQLGQFTRHRFFLRRQRVGTFETHQGLIPEDTSNHRGLLEKSACLFGQAVQPSLEHTGYRCRYA